MSASSASPFAASSGAVTAPAIRTRAERGTAIHWVRLVVATLSRGILFTLAGMLLLAALPAAWGWLPSTVMSDSMAPRIIAGDVIVAMPATARQLKLGQVILVDDPDHAGHLRLHRYVDMNSDGQLVTKGDANAQRDSTPIAASAVHGFGVLRIPYVGSPSVWLHYGQWQYLAITALVLMALLYFARWDRYLIRQHRAESQERGIRALVPGAGGVLVLVLALAVSTAAIVSTGAHASFASTATNPSNALNSTAFDCLTVTPADSPYFFYGYQETTGTSATDSSTNTRTGTLTTGATRSTGSCVKNASPSIVLDGSSGQVTSPLVGTAPNTFTIETWFKTTTTTGGKLIGFGSSQSGQSGNYDRHLYMANNGQIYFGVYNNAVKTIVSPSSYNDGSWHLATASLSTAGMKLYMDGALVASLAGTTAGEVNSGYWRIGYDNLAGWVSVPTKNYFTGSLDNTAVYTTALTAAQVLAHYNTGH